MPARRRLVVFVSAMLIGMVFYLLVFQCLNYFEKSIYNDHARVHIFLHMYANTNSPSVLMKISEHKFEENFYFYLIIYYLIISFNYFA